MGPELSGIFFPLRNFVWTSCSVRFPLLFAGNCDFNGSTQRYLQHLGVRTSHFLWYLQHFGASTVHVAWYFQPFGFRNIFYCFFKGWFQRLLALDLGLLQFFLGWFRVYFRVYLGFMQTWFEMYVGFVQDLFRGGLKFVQGWFKFYLGLV